MSHDRSNERPSTQQSGHSANELPWQTFEEILHRLHNEGIYIHPHQLAEFFLMHGLPVDLRYVPDHLQQKATFINENYLGEMARLEEIDEQPWYSYQLG